MTPQIKGPIKPTLIQVSINSLYLPIPWNNNCVVFMNYVLNTFRQYVCLCHLLWMFSPWKLARPLSIFIIKVHSEKQQQETELPLLNSIKYVFNENLKYCINISEQSHKLCLEDKLQAICNSQEEEKLLSHWENTYQWLDKAGLKDSGW